jgi:hypothetical protein
MKTGQYVECISDFTVDFKNYQHLGVKLPVKGKIYTVRGFHVSGEHIYLVEIINSKESYKDGYGEPAFHKDDFRLLVLPSIKELMYETATV